MRKLKIGISLNESRVKLLSRDIKWKVAEDFGIGYDERSSFLDKNPDLLIDTLLSNMGKQDRNRAVLELLLEIESADRAERAISLNLMMMFWTGLAALATFATALFVVLRG
ncbi:hypothetical protein KF728_09790 [Candidatus Obscuribacterales bacterium]|nr:hypothetical protein [Candidatus Obscuribacterales bacterium]